MQVTTTEEVAALPAEAVVRDTWGEVWEAHMGPSRVERWYTTGSERGIADDRVQVPALVLYDPKAAI